MLEYQSKQAAIARALQAYALARDLALDVDGAREAYEAARWKIATPIAVKAALETPHTPALRTALQASTNQTGRRALAALDGVDARRRAVLVGKADIKRHAKADKARQRVDGARDAVNAARDDAQRALRELAAFMPDGSLTAARDLIKRLQDAAVARETPRKYAPAPERRPVKIQSASQAARYGWQEIHEYLVTPWDGSAPFEYTATGAPTRTQRAFVKSQHPTADVEHVGFVAYVNSDGDTESRRERRRRERGHTTPACPKHGARLAPYRGSDAAWYCHVCGGAMRWTARKISRYGGGGAGVHLVEDTPHIAAETVKAVRNDGVVRRGGKARPVTPAKTAQARRARGYKTHK